MAKFCIFSHLKINFSGFKSVGRHPHEGGIAHHAFLCFLCAHGPATNETLYLDKQLINYIF